MKGRRWILLIVLYTQFPTVAIAAWEDWWRTPEQRAARAFVQGDNEALIDTAPNISWKGIAQFRAEDYDAASATFGEAARQLQLDGAVTAANRARYNQGVSEVRAGRYQQAIDQFDAVLGADPDFEDAVHNRGIAEQLLQMQEQQQSSPDNQEGGQQGDPQQQGEQGQQQGNAGSNADKSEQQGEPNGTRQGDQPTAQQDGQQSGEQAARQRNDQTTSTADGEAESADQPVPAQSPEDQAQAAEQARQALAAEAAAQADEDKQSNGQNLADGQADERPMTEGEQATEQLLRRIPDDPAGLLRRKLEQSHRSEYPEVRDAVEPW
jgi:Ca-activated chloride channel family protein